MAEFTITMKDKDDGGMDASIELKGFKGASIDRLDENTCAQTIYFALAENFKKWGIKIPEID